MPDFKKPLTALGFDFGTKRIGVAVGQTLTLTTQALPILSWKENSLPWEEITKLIKTWRPEALVVGIPFNMDGSENELAFKAQHFANELKERYKLPVYTVDERLSTFEARDRIATHPKKSKRQQKVDNIAAQVILESWLKTYRDNAS